MACEDSQSLDEGTKDVIRTLFDTIKQKPNFKSYLSLHQQAALLLFCTTWAGECLVKGWKKS